MGRDYAGEAFKQARRRKVRAVGGDNLALESGPPLRHRSGISKAPSSSSSARVQKLSCFAASFKVQGF